MTFLQIVVTFAYLGGIGFVVIAGVRFIFRFAHPEESTTLAQIPARKEAPTPPATTAARKQNDRQEVDVMEANADSRGQSGAETPSAPLRGVNGWLKFFVIVNLYVSPVLFVLQSAVGWISFASIAGDYPGIIPVGMIETGVGGFLVWKWIQIARGLRDIRPGIVQEAKTWLQIALAWNLFSLPLVYLSGLDAEDLVVGSLRQAVQAVIGFTIWYSYFNVSKRVEATYLDWKG